MEKELVLASNGAIWEEDSSDEEFVRQMTQGDSLFVGDFGDVHEVTYDIDPENREFHEYDNIQEQLRIGKRFDLSILACERITKEMKGYYPSSA